MTTNPKPRLAIIGTGISGLTAAWLLKDSYQVSLFEKASKLGMGQKGIEYETPVGPRRIDVPLRVFSSRYYPHLYRLCQRLGVKVRLLDNDSSFSSIERETYFRYFNLQIGSRSFSYIKPRYGQIKWTARFLKEYFRLKKHVQRPGIEANGHISIEDFFIKHGYSSTFTNEFFYPFFAAVCTCSYEALKAFPASVLLGLFQSFTAPEPMRRWVGGTTELESALACDMEDIHFDTNIMRIDQKAQGVSLTFDHGGQLNFDKAILALQANQASAILGDDFTSVKKLLTRIPYAKLEVAVHGDESVMPLRKKDWATVNYTLSSMAEKPQASLWLNRGEQDFELVKENLFQTVNPQKNLKNLIKQTSFERSLVTVDSLKAVHALINWQEQEQQDIYFCGAYLAEKLPLLENGVVSAIRISRQLGAKIPDDLTL